MLRERQQLHFVVPDVLIDLFLLPRFHARYLKYFEPFLFVVVKLVVGGFGDEASQDVDVEQASPALANHFVAIVVVVVWGFVVVVAVVVVVVLVDSAAAVVVAVLAVVVAVVVVMAVVLNFEIAGWVLCLVSCACCSPLIHPQPLARRFGEADCFALGLKFD